MTSAIKIREDETLGRIVKVNGIDRYDLVNIKAVEPVIWGGRAMKSEFVVTHSSGDQFIVYGGKHSGGSRNEWFVRRSDTTFPCSSLVACLKDISSL